MAWTVEFSPAARKNLKAIRDTRLRARIVRALKTLEADPRPAGAKRLAGQAGVLRLRVGAWRILYEVRDREVVVLVVRIGPRGEVYERLPGAG